MASSWITSTSCSSSVISKETSLPSMFQWMRFVFLSPVSSKS
ncbi:hypothetical protein SLEP1_g50325 [Rubroshorea leprosula]|uniref:Uncharacterized protein n=1 Tax=Rubroshorea leprosula TaxID=152421 RepID=A0AAV5LZW4_9ROSI|nr:hypothetical protein SLEP1_g50325 [Rubroshorea leprosula]